MADFVKALVRALYRYGTAAFILGLVIAVVIWAFDQWAGDWVAKAMNTIALTLWEWTLRSPGSAAIVYCATLVAVCAIVATRDEVLRKYVEFVREPDEPALQIVYRPGQFGFLHTYPNGSNPSITTYHFRILILNISKRTQISDIEVRLERLDPPLLPCVPCHLRLMNNIPPQVLIEQFTLNRDGKKFVDVMAQDPGGSDFYIWHTVLPISILIPAQRYTFTISATSKDAPTVSENFVLEQNGPIWEMRMLPCD